MVRSKQDDAPNAGAAVVAALDAEAEARARRERAESQARDLISAARRRAQEISQHADARIRRAQMRVAALTAADSERIRAEGEAALREVAANPADSAAIAAAARRVADLVFDTAGVSLPSDPSP